MSSQPPLNRLIGKVLREDLTNEQGAVVIPKDTRMTSENAAKAARHRLRPVLWGAHLNGSGAALGEDEPGAWGLTEEACQRLIEEATIQLREIFHFANKSGGLPDGISMQSIAPALMRAASFPRVGHLLRDLALKDEYTIRHSVSVGVLSAMLGRLAGLGPNEVQELTLAATLHDIGKVSIPSELLSSPDSPTAQEWEIIRRHTLYGYALLLTSGEITPRQARVALQHHERMDGSGYPRGLKGDAIGIFSRIVAVADVFDAMGSNRSYRAAYPLFEVLEELHRGMFGRYDGGFTHLFLGRMMENLIGERVVLTDGRSGLIVLINSPEPLRPVVRLDQGFVDLSVDYSVQIREVL